MWSDIDIEFEASQEQKVHTISIHRKKYRYAFIFYLTSEVGDIDSMQTGTLIAVSASENSPPEVEWFNLRYRTAHNNEK